MEKLLTGDNLERFEELEDNSVDLIVTDPPYGLHFMNKDWDKAVPPVQAFKECLRVLKPGAFAFIMCTPRQDCLARMIMRLEEAGFETGFTSTYWTFARGFPKAADASKAADKRAGMKREVIGQKTYREDAREYRHTKGNDQQFGIKGAAEHSDMKRAITRPVTPEAQALTGAYLGYQPKPALELILHCQKPLTTWAELTIITSQALMLIEETLKCVNVKTVEKNSSLLMEAKDYIVQRPAMEKLIGEAKVQIGKVGGFYDLMDTLKFMWDIQIEKQNMNLNIDWLWKGILVDLLSQANRFTIETATAQITELRTLNLYLSQTIQDCIIRGKTSQNGGELNVTVVESFLKSALTRLRSLNPITAHSIAGVNQSAENILCDADFVENISQSEARESNENIVAENAIIKHHEGRPDSESSADIVAKNSRSSQLISKDQKQESYSAPENITSRPRRSPEVKVILVAMKPLSEKSYLDQALANRKGISWLDDGRIPFMTERDRWAINRDGQVKTDQVFLGMKRSGIHESQAGGRFPANLLVQDKVLDDGKNHPSGNKLGCIRRENKKCFSSAATTLGNPLWWFGDGPGSFNRYFDLDLWWSRFLERIPPEALDTFPFLITPKPSPGEKDKGCEAFYWERVNIGLGFKRIDFQRWAELGEEEARIHREEGRWVSLRARGCIHATVKPIQLFSWLITIGSREGDLVLDPWMGSGTTACAARLTRRNFIGIELEEVYMDIAQARASKYGPLATQLSLI